MYAVHKINHFAVPNGTGRDAMMFTDGFWQRGRVYGSGLIPQVHPMFSKVTQSKIPKDVIRHAMQRQNNVRLHLTPAKRALSVPTRTCRELFSASSDVQNKIPEKLARNDEMRRLREYHRSQQKGPLPVIATPPKPAISKQEIGVQTTPRKQRN